MEYSIDLSNVIDLTSPLFSSSSSVASTSSSSSSSPSTGDPYAVSSGMVITPPHSTSSRKRSNSNADAASSPASTTTGRKTRVRQQQQQQQDEAQDQEGEEEQEQEEGQKTAEEQEAVIVNILHEQLCKKNRSLVALKLKKLAASCRLDADQGAHINNNNNEVVQRNYSVVMAHGGIHCVTLIMRQNPDHVGILMHGCCTLANLMCLHEEAEDIVDRVGGLNTILEAMKSFTNVEPMQRTGLVALKNFIVNEKDRKKRIESLVEAGAIEVVVEAMRHHPDNGEMHRLACFALSMMCQDHADEIYKAQGYSTVVRSHEMFRASNDAIRTHSKLIMRKLQDYVDSDL